MLFNAGVRSSSSDGGDGTGRRRTFVVGAAAFSLVLLVGCANRAPRSTAPTGEGSPNPVHIDLKSSNNIGGEQVDSLSAVSSDLSFDAFAPHGLGDPVAIYITDRSTVEKSYRVIEFDFDGGANGPIVVEEYPAEAPIETWDDQIKTLVAANGQADTHGSATPVTIRGGKSAVLLVSEDGAASEVQWYESPDFEVIVYGLSLPSDSAVQIADKL
jgi:hypothetical protein